MEEQGSSNGAIKPSDESFKHEAASSERVVDVGEQLSAARERPKSQPKTAQHSIPAHSESSNLGNKNPTARKSEETGTNSDPRANLLHLDILPFREFPSRSFIFPFHLAKTWAGIKALIQQALADIEELGRYISEENYDLLTIEHQIILPQVWEAIIWRGALIKLRFKNFVGEALPGSPEPQIQRESPRRQRFQPTEPIGESSWAWTRPRQSPLERFREEERLTWGRDTASRSFVPDRIQIPFAPPPLNRPETWESQLRDAERYTKLAEEGFARARDTEARTTHKPFGPRYRTSSPDSWEPPARSASPPSLQRVRTKIVERGREGREESSLPPRSRVVVAERQPERSLSTSPRERPVRTRSVERGRGQSPSPVDTNRRDLGSRSSSWSPSPVRTRARTFSRERLRDPSTIPNNQALVESRNRVIQNRDEPPLRRWAPKISRTFSFKRSRDSIHAKSAVPPPRPAPGFGDDGEVDNSYQVAQSMVLQKNFQAFDFKVLMLWDLLRLQRKVSDKLHTFRDKPGHRGEDDFFDVLAKYRGTLLEWLQIQRFSRSKRQDVDVFQLHLKNHLSTQEYEKLRGTGLWEGNVIDLLVTENETASRVRKFLQKILPFRISTVSDEAQFEEHTTAISLGNLPRRKSQAFETKAEKEKDEMIQKLRERHFSPIVDSLARLIISICGGLLLVVPMIVLVKVTSLNWRLGIVVMSVLLFATALSQVSRASNQELLTTVAAYAAVLTVFFGQIG